MEVKAIAHSYWRSIKKGARTFDSVKNSKIASVKSLTEDIRYLAKTDVVDNIITTEEYEAYIGEAYII